MIRLEPFGPKLTVCEPFFNNIHVSPESKLMNTFCSLLSRLRLGPALPLSRTSPGAPALVATRTTPSVFDECKKHGDSLHFQLFGALI
jgi:hypothetical protein